MHLHQLQTKMKGKHTHKKSRFGVGTYKKALKNGLLIVGCHSFFTILANNYLAVYFGVRL